MPTARAWPGVAEVNGLLYVVGGFSGSGELGTVEVYDAASDTWLMRAPMPTPRHQMAMGVIGDQIYAAGGFNNGTRSALEVYDPATDTWTTRLPMPIAAQTPGAVVNDRLYVIGGDSHGFCRSTVQAYDPSTDTWSLGASMPTPRCHVGVAAVDGLIYVFGGSDTSSTVVYSTVEVYDPATNTWHTVASMPTARSSPAVASVGGKIYAVGGTRLGGGSLSAVEAYDPLTNTWTVEAPLPTPRTEAVTGAAGGVLHVLGGYSAPDFLATNEAFVPESVCVPPPAGIVSWLPGDGNARDVQGGNDATSGASSFAPGKVQQAFSFNGTSDFLGLGNPSSLQLGRGDMTVEAWVNFAALLTPTHSICTADGCDQSIVGKMVPPSDGGGVPNTDGWRLLKQADNHLWFCLGAGGNGCVAGAATTVRSSTPVQARVWYHVAAVRSASGIAIYVNGVLQDSKPLPAFVDSDSADVFVGVYPEESLMYGLVDEVVIYDRALPASDIDAIYRAGQAGKCRPANGPPVAEAGLDQSVECATPTAVTLDATASTDPDGDSLTYEWFEGSTLLGTGAVLATTLGFGAHTITLTVTDADGASAHDTVMIDVVDTMPPSVTAPPSITVRSEAGTCQASVDPGVATAADNCGEVTAMPVRSDGQPLGAPFPVGTTTITWTATDAAGGTTSANQQVTVSDVEPPVTTSALSHAPNAAGWHNRDVTVTLSATDDCSGLPEIRYRLGDNLPWVPYAGPFVVAGEGRTTISYGSVDRAGNAEAPKTLFIRLDKTPPEVAIVSPAQVNYTLNQPVAAAYACADGGSGIAGCAGPVPSGGLIDTASLGPKVFAVTATDVADNVSVLQVSYGVAYNVCVLYDQDKVHRRGSTIPIKLQLCDAHGVNLSSPDITLTALQTVPVAGDAQGELEDAGNANPDDNFRFTSLDGAGGYIFNLDITGLTIGTYALVFRAAGDPFTHTTRFKVR